MYLGKVSKVGNSASFRGYEKKLDKKGNDVYSFYYPHSDKYKLELELLFRSKTTGKMLKKFANIKDKNFEINFPKSVENNSDIFYRYKLTELNKKGEAVSNPIYAIDNGLLEDPEKNGESYNRLIADRKIVSKPGRMQLQVPDMYYPGVEYNGSKYVINKAERAKALATVRNHVNKLGGTINGMTMTLPQRAEEGYTRIVGTPFTKDELSSHLYWTQNAYQTASSIGTESDMKRFQKELFRNGINFISDAALVNESMQGIHFSSLMKWGKESPFFHWFKTYNLDSNSLSLGIIPENSKYVKMKIVNSPVNTEANPVKPHDYNPSRPTYVQLYDSRLVSKEQETSNKVFTKYDKNPDNHYEITTNEDAVMPYAFEVDPKELAQNMRKFDATKKGDFSDLDMILNLLNFSKFQITQRTDGGFEHWDGNVDIVKLNFSYGDYDEATINKGTSCEIRKQAADYKQGVREVRDYAVLSGKYWTKSMADTQLEYAASAFKDVKSTASAIKKIKDNVGKILPKSVLNPDIVDKTVIENVLNDDYNLFKLNNISTYTHIDKKDNRTEEELTSYEDILKKSIMNLPLEVLEVGDDVSSILSSGYLTKRASTDGQIGLTRFDIYKSNYPNLNEKYAFLYKKTDALMASGVYDFIDKVINSYDKFSGTEKIKDKNGDITTFGKYAINAVAADLTKYALLKALDNEANITVNKDGSLNFDNIDKERLSVKALRLEATTPQKEAINLIKKFAVGITVLNNNQKAVNQMATALHNRLAGLNENSFKLADMIMDRTESGMGLRVDAAKDIAAIDSVRDGNDSFAKAIDDVIDFWSSYVKDGVQKENPHAYTTAEITDIDKFITKHPIEDFISAPQIVRKIVEKTGVTSTANYDYLFDMPAGLYSNNPETGQGTDSFNNISSLKAKLDGLDNDWFDNSGMLFEGMPDTSIHSYTFSGNHDKPRILHVLGLDMALYNAEEDNDDLRKAAQYVLNIGNGENFEELAVACGQNTVISAPAIAMGKRLKDVFASMKKLSEKEKDALADKYKKNPIIADAKEKKINLENSVLDRISDNGELNDKERILTNKQFEKISNAIARLALGIYSVGEDGAQTFFNPDSFGQKPFDIVLNDVLKTADLKLSDKDLKKIYDMAFKKIMLPALEKYRCIYKMLVALPGDPTDFAGDKIGMTGFESKSKNVSQQNRNVIKWEWLNDKSKDFIANYKADLDNILKLRSHPKLSALNDGHTITLYNKTVCEGFDNPRNCEYSAIFRYNSSGSQVVAIFGKPDTGTTPKPGLKLGSKIVKTPYIYLDSTNEKEGLIAGLKEGTIFKNADPKDKSIYKVEKTKVKVPIEAPEDTDPVDIVYKNYDVDGRKKGLKKYIYKDEQHFVIKRYNGKKSVPIEVSRNDDNVLILYKV